MVRWCERASVMDALAGPRAGFPRAQQVIALAAGIWSSAIQYTGRPRNAILYASIS